MCLHAKMLQSCLTFCDPMDCSPPGSSVHRISRQEYLRVLLCHPPGIILTRDQTLKSPALASGFFTTSTTWEAIKCYSALQLNVFKYNIIIFPSSLKPTLAFSISESEIAISKFIPRI